jgi:hypothetical protein
MKIDYLEHAVTLLVFHRFEHFKKYVRTHLEDNDAPPFVDESRKIEKEKLCYEQHDELVCY